MKIHFPPFLAILLFLQETSRMATVEAAASFNAVLTCETRQFSDGTSASTCATQELYSPSPGVNEYGNETIYVGGYTDTFDFYEGFPEGTVAPDNATSWLTVTARRDDDDQCSVTVGEANCNACAYCSENDGYSADCTNVAVAVGDGGDYVGLEVTCMVREPFYFPLDKKPSESNAQGPATSPTTQAGNDKDGGSSSTAASKGTASRILLTATALGMYTFFA
jgi:hypothetical protein